VTKPTAPAVGVQYRQPRPASEPGLYAVYRDGTHIGFVEKKVRTYTGRAPIVVWVPYDLAEQRIEAPPQPTRREAAHQLVRSLA